MADFGTDFNNQQFNIIPTTLVDQVSSIFIYIGTSKNGNNQDANIWQIQLISLDGTVWSTQFPDGDQSFVYAWSGRAGYSYQ